MDKVFDHNKFERTIYDLWEKSGAFTPKRDPKKKPYTIVLPLPNASGKMHVGNVLMIAIQDLLIRWKRMQGFSALWIPGTDHAGFETQITFERHLKSLGKSRLDYDRQTLYKKIWNFVQKNKGLIDNQIREMGASVDWTRYKFSLDKDVVKTVLKTFVKLHRDNLLYKDDYLVNYCPDCGTTFADLEVKHKKKNTSLYYLRYGPLRVATTRPETIFGDTALAVHPDDKRYTSYVGKKVLVGRPEGKVELEVIADRYVDPDFGTGVVKITPAHDKNDYEIGKRHSLKMLSVIDIDGRLNKNTGKYAGLTVSEARKKVVKDLNKLGLVEKIDVDYVSTSSLCYKGAHDIEPTILPNWFIKVKNIKELAHDAVKKGGVRIFPKWQEIKYHRWMESMQDWPISRQIVWGIRIPAWYNLKINKNILISFLDRHGKAVTGKAGKLLQKYSFGEIERGLQTMLADKGAQYVVSIKKPAGKFLQETDTLDTWFSSGQWPLVTLGYPNSPDFKYFYPTSVLETAWEILRLWVSRMIMFGIYLTKKPPFKDVYLHGVVRALDGKKMSKSLGNVIIPSDYQKEYGTDALRMGLIAGTATGKDFNFPKDKVVAYRNFANKLWNIGRFIKTLFESEGASTIPHFSDQPEINSQDKKIVKKLGKTINAVNKYLEQYKMAQAAETLYHFVWNDIASTYLEEVKNRKDKTSGLATLRYVYFYSLKLFHPFMPFVTEAIWQELSFLRKDPKELLINSSWPKT